MNEITLIFGGVGLYFIAGLLYSLFMGWATRRFNQQNGEEPLVPFLSTKEHNVLILLWPIFLSVFVVIFIFNVLKNIINLILGKK